MRNRRSTKWERFQEAYGYFDLCNEWQPDHAATLYMRGRALLDLRRLEEALADNQRAHRARSGQSRNLQHYRRGPALAGS